MIKLLLMEMVFGAGVIALADAGIRNLVLYFVFYWITNIKRSK